MTRNAGFRLPLTLSLSDSGIYFYPLARPALPLTLSLSDSGIYFYPLARPAPRAEYEFPFCDIAAPATSGRQAIASAR
jgi:hypothetical protein